MTDRDTQKQEAEKLSPTAAKVAAGFRTGMGHGPTILDPDGRYAGREPAPHAPSAAPPSPALPRFDLGLDPREQKLAFIGTRLPDLAARIAPPPEGCDALSPVRVTAKREDDPTGADLTATQTLLRSAREQFRTRLLQRCGERIAERRGDLERANHLPPGPDYTQETAYPPSQYWHGHKQAFSETWAAIEREEMTAAASLLEQPPAIEPTGEGDAWRDARTGLHFTGETRLLFTVDLAEDRDDLRAILARINHRDKRLLCLVVTTWPPTAAEERAVEKLGAQLLRWNPKAFGEWRREHHPDADPKLTL